MNVEGQNQGLTEASLKDLSDKKFRLMMAEEIWMLVKGVPIPDSYSEEDRLHIFERYYHRASAQRQGE